MDLQNLKEHLDQRIDALCAYARARFTLLALTALSLACTSPKAPQKLPASVETHVRFLAAVNRLEANFLENGWVVSRKSDGSPEHEGDSLLWSGVALGILPCSHGKAIETNLINTVTRLEGQLVRYEPLGEYADGREVSFDGAVGLWFGLSRRLRCEGVDAAWLPALKAHEAFLKSSGRLLHRGSEAVYPPGFDYLPAALFSRVGLSSSPHGSDLRLLVPMVEAWTVATVSNRKPCFRVHLGYLALKAVEASGRSVDWQKFCLATGDAGIPLVDHQCGRGGLEDWTEGFALNEYEYRHQRCDFESEDTTGLETPALDLIFAMRELYDLGD